MVAAAVLGIPYLAGAQTSDSTRVDSTVAPGSHWKTYRQENGPRRYQYTDDAKSSFQQHLMVGGGLSLSF